MDFFHRFNDVLLRTYWERSLHLKNKFMPLPKKVVCLSVFLVSKKIDSGIPKSRELHPNWCAELKGLWVFFISVCHFQPWALPTCRADIEMLLVTTFRTRFQEQLSCLRGSWPAWSHRPAWSEFWPGARNYQMFNEKSLKKDSSHILALFVGHYKIFLWLSQDMNILLISLAS